MPAKKKKMGVKKKSKKVKDPEDEEEKCPLDIPEF